jgi:hypothetical protein
MDCFNKSIIVHGYKENFYVKEGRLAWGGFLNVLGIYRVRWRLLRYLGTQGIKFRKK